MLKKINKYNILFLLLVFVFSSCDPTKQSIQVADDQKTLLNKLENFKKIKVDSLIASSDFIDKYILAKWLNRNEKYDSARLLLEEIEEEMKQHSLFDPIYQDYIIDRLITKRQNKDYDINDNLYFLEEVEKRKSQDLLDFKIRLLTTLSSTLVNKSDVEFSFCSSAYALSLLEETNLDEYYKSLVYFTHAINLIREIETGPDSFFMKKAFSNCSDLSNPVCKKMKILELFTLGVENIEDFDSTTLDNLLDTNYFAPAYTNFITTQLGWMINDPEMKNKFLKAGNGNDDYCGKGFLNALYLIDDFLIVNELDSAKYYLDILVDSCDMSKESFEYIFLRRQMKYHLNSYFNNSDKTYLYSALESAEKSNIIRANSFRKRDGFHYADFIYGNFIDQLECYYHLIKSDTSKKLHSRFFNCINDGRSFEKNVESYTDMIASKLNINEYKEYIKVIKTINKLEYEVGRYRDTLIRKSNVYHDIFNEYLIKHKLENSIKNKTAISEHINERDVKLFLKKNNAQILEYDISDSSIYITHISPDIVEINNQNTKVLKSVVEFIKKIEQKKEINEISSILFNSIIKNNIDTTIKNLIIIPSGLLSRLPFEALMNNEEYLLDKYNISYNFDINSVISEDGIESDDKVSIFSYSSNKTIKSKRKRKVPELVFGMEEAKAIEEIYSNSFLIQGEEFVKSNLSDLENSDIIHFSTHSYSDPTELFNNYMMIRDENGDSKKLFGFEIRGLDLNAANVTLSSCESGTGVHKNGAGTVSFSRSFFNSGAKSVTKSLWKVNEKSTSKLMIEYHNNIKNGLTFSKALTEAKRNLKKDSIYKHPYYWAGFVLEGNPNIKIK